MSKDVVRRFEPLDLEHPLVRDQKECHACHKVFLEGDQVVLVPLGPGDDPDARERRDEGRVYNAVALPVHYECAGSEYR